MASLEWYIFSGCCDSSTFQVQSLTPPADFQIGDFYYLLTDQYTGCTNLIATGYSPSTQIYTLQSYSPQVFANCVDCITYYPCQILPTLTPTTTPPPTPGFGLTPNVTRTQTPTLTRTVTRTPTKTINQTPNVTKSLTPSVTNTRTNTPTQNAVYWFSGCCNNQNIVFGVINSTNIIPPNRFYYIQIINQFSICTTSIVSGSGIVYDNSEIIIIETDPYLGCNGCISQYGCDPIPTPSPTITNTITKTPTNTQTPTNTPTNTQTPSNTPTNTQTPSNTPTNTQTQTPTTTQTQTNTITPTPEFTPTNTQIPTNTPTNTTTVTNTPSYTPSNTTTFTPTKTKTQTPTNTPTVTNTPSYTPSNTVTPTKTNTPLPTLESPPYSSTPTPTNTMTPSVSTGSGCLVSSYCLSTNISGYSDYNGTYINYGVLNGYSVFYCPTSIIPAYIYYNTGLTQWCVSQYYNGIPIMFGPSKSISVCPDFDSSILNTICPTPLPTSSLGVCETFNFEAIFDCIPFGTPTPTTTVTMTPTPTTTVTPTQLCYGKSILVSGITIPYSIGSVPTSTFNNVLRNCLITGETIFNTFNSGFGSVYSKLLIDCNSGLQYIVSEPIPFSSGSTFSALIDGNPVCVTYNSNVISSPINVLNSIESGNLFDCFWCVPPYSPTPTNTSTVTPTNTLTPTKTPTSTKCLNTLIDFSFVVGSGVSGGQVYDTYELSDGRIILAGNFTSYRNTSVNGLCIIKNDGSIDTTFTNTGVSVNNLTSIAVDEINKSIYCNSGSRNITKINFSGDVDTVFSSNIGFGFNFKVTKLLILSSSTGSCNVLCIGPFTKFNNLTYNNLISLFENGLVSNYANFKLFDSYPLNVSKDSENNLVFVGNFSSYDGKDYSRIIKLNPDGSINNSFSSYTFNDIVNNVVIDNEDNIYCSGKFTNYNSITSNQIIKLSSSGQVLQSTSNSFGTVNSISLNVNKNLLYLAGNFSASTVSNIGFNNLISLNSDLSINYSFGSSPGFNGVINKIFTQSSDKLLITGNFTSYNNLIGFNNIIRLYPCQPSLSPPVTPTQTPTTITCSSIQSQGLVGSGPKYLSYDYNNNKYYITNNVSGTISVVDSSLNTITTLTPSTGTTSLEGVIYTPNGYFYVADSLNQVLYVYESAGDTLVNTFTISYNIKNLELASTYGQILLSTNSGEIVFFNYIFNSIDSVLSVGSGEIFSRFDILNNRVFISSTLGNSILVYDYVSNLLTNPITLTSSPKDLILNSVNNLLYVVQPSSYEISIFETSYYTQISTITLPYVPEYLTLSVYDNYVYVSSPSSNTIFLINGNNNTYICLGSISSSQQLIYNQNKSTIYGVSYDSESIFELSQYTPITPTPTTTPATPTPTPTNTITPTITNTQTITQTNTQTNTITPTITNTQTITPTITNTQTITQTNTQTNTQTITQTNTQTNTPSLTTTITPTITKTLTPSSTPLSPGSIDSLNVSWPNSSLSSILSEPGGLGNYIFGGSVGLSTSVSGTNTIGSVVTNSEFTTIKAVTSTAVFWYSGLQVMDIIQFTGNTVLFGGIFNNWNNSGPDDLVLLDSNYNKLSYFTSPFTDNSTLGNRFVNKIFKTNDNGILLSNRQNVSEGVTAGWGSMRKLTSTGSNFAGFNQNGQTNTISTGINGNSYSATSISNFAVKSNESQIVLVGNFTSYTISTSSYTANNIIAINSGGTIDLTFTGGTGTNAPINEIITVSTGGYLFGGTFTQYSGVSVNSLVKITDTGSIDNTFSARTFSALTRIDLIRENSSGKFVIFGKFDGYDGQVCRDFIVLNSDGSLNTSYTYFTSSTLNSGTPYKIFTDLLETSSSYIVTGRFYEINGFNRFGLAEIVK